MRPADTIKRVGELCQTNHIKVTDKANPGARCCSHTARGAPSLLLREEATGHPPDHLAGAMHRAVHRGDGGELEHVHVTLRDVEGGDERGRKCETEKVG